MTADDLRALLIVDNAPHDHRFTLFVTEQNSSSMWVILTPPAMRWAPHDIKAVVALIPAIFPTASDIREGDSPYVEFRISGNDIVHLRLMERGDTRLCVECEGGGWILVSIPSTPPPSFVECTECGNPFEFPCP